MSNLSQITRIVVPTDGLDERHPGLLVAADLGARLGIPVELLSVAPTDQVAERFALVQHAARELGANVGGDVVVSDDVEAAIARLRGDDDTLICLPSSGHMAAVEVAIRSISASVLAETDRPMLVVGPRCRPLLAGRQFAIAVDGTQEAESIVTPALDLARALGLDPALYQVLAASSGTNRLDVPDTGYLARLAQTRQRHPGEISFDVLHDDHAGSALDRASTDPEVAIVALASHGNNPVERLLEPSIAHRLIRHATCPILVGPRTELPSSGTDTDNGLTRGKRMVGRIAHAMVIGTTTSAAIPVCAAE